MSSPPPQITLYTSRDVPYAHRVHICLEELGVKYQEVEINLDKPRDPEFLKINPRGLIPVLVYSDGNVQNVVITESTIITQFLCDAYPSHLLPASSDGAQAALFRARVNFFIDTWNTKVGGYMWSMFKADTDIEREQRSREWVAAIAKEIEPLLQDANPFFAGRNRMSLADVTVAPFLLRIYALSNGKILPVSLKEGLQRLPHFSRWATAIMAQPSVRVIWDEADIVASVARRVARLKAQTNGVH